MLKLIDRVDAFPNQLWLEICSKPPASPMTYSNDIARRNAYISQLCVTTIVEWLQTEPDFQTESIAILPDEANLPTIWEFLPGAVIQLGQTKLALIPSETIDPDQFCVPFEWVDIPNWAADYYLAVQMDLEDEEQWLRVWGFTTHQALKAGTVDPVKRLYKLDREEMNENLNVLWAIRSAQSVTPKEPPHLATASKSLPALSPLSLDQLESLLAQLSQPTLYSPRLEVPFDQWAAVIANDRWRNLLCERRQQALMKPTVQSTVQSSVNLRQWLQQTVEEAWQTVESLFATAQAIPVRGVPQTDSSLNAIAAQNSPAIAPILRLVQSTNSEQIRQQAAGILGEIGANHPEAIEALVNLVQTAQQEETRWQAALSLGKIAPHHPLAGIRRARLLDLGVQLSDYSLALVVAIMPKPSDSLRGDQRVSVFLQVQSLNPQLHLPPQLKIKVLSESGETRLQAESRSDEQGRGKDKSIDLRFSPPAGSRFRVKIELNDACVTEEFLA